MRHSVHITALPNVISFPKRAGFESIGEIVLRLVRNTAPSDGYGEEAGDGWRCQSSHPPPARAASPRGWEGSELSSEAIGGGLRYRVNAFVGSEHPVLVADVGEEVVSVDDGHARSRVFAGGLASMDVKTSMDVVLTGRKQCAAKPGS